LLQEVFVYAVNNVPLVVPADTPWSHVLRYTLACLLQSSSRTGRTSVVVFSIWQAGFPINISLDTVLLWLHHFMM
jgi:hypothetical protein